MLLKTGMLPLVVGERGVAGNKQCVRPATTVRSFLGQETREPERGVLRYRHNGLNLNSRRLKTVVKAGKFTWGSRCCF